MPELPEVEHIVRYLRPRVTGRRVEAVAPPALARALVGRTLRGVARRAKLVLLPLDRGGTLVFHLKLTGKLWVRAAGDPPGRHVRLVLGLSGGQALVLEDARRLGWARVLDDAALAAALAGLGPEPLEPAFDLAALRARLAARRRSRLKPLLLDPAFVAGIGNIYADEVLFAARLHPLARAGDLDAPAVRRLHGGIKRVLGAALAARTDEVPDQERVGAGGRGAARRLALAVFQKDGQPCPRCRATLTRTVVAGRGTYLCARCQQG
ncbi:MAG: formamidopyrimidine-DNA glycosylase [Planctomycetes bacterium]|nr:formamidopyrimidine-DNA glycosylase [Planctomycetota bacterium]